MIFRPGTQWEKKLLPSIAPIFRIDPDKKIVYLIGTGFWITDKGHLVTARHVIQDNIDHSGEDKGPIFAVQMRQDRSVITRGLSKSDLHPSFDLALCETDIPGDGNESTIPLPISFHYLETKDRVCSFAVFSYEKNYEDQFEGFIPYTFNGSLTSSYTEGQIPVRFAIGFSIGEVNAIFEEKRDSVMMPFPCIETSVRIYGGNSGGPLLDDQGRICGIHCSSYDGERISYHVPTHGLLNLKMRAMSLGIKDESRNDRSIMDLAMDQKIECIPPLLDENRIARSFLIWIRYIRKCKQNNEVISRDINFGTSTLEIKQNVLEKISSYLIVSIICFILKRRSNKETQRTSVNTKKGQI